MENIWNLVASAAVLAGAGLFGSIAVCLPGTGVFKLEERKQYYTVQVSRTLVKKVEIKEWTDPGYEKGVFNAPAILARFNPHLNATKEEIEAWNEITFEEPTFEHISINCEETVEIEEEPTLSPNVMAALDEYFETIVDNDEADHPDTCVCFTCAPFGVSAMGARIPKIKANTKALIEELNYLDTIGNPDRADAFFSRGYKSTDSDLPPDFYNDDDNLAQDWYDSQLYV